MIVLWHSMSTAPGRPDHGFDESGPWFWATVLWADGDRSVVQIRREKRGRWWETSEFGRLDEDRGVRPICWRPKTKADEPFEGDPAELERVPLSQHWDWIKERGPVCIGMDFGNELATIYGGSIEVSSSHGLHEQKIGRVLREGVPPDRASSARDALLYALRWHSAMHVPVNHVSNLMTKLGNGILDNIMRTMIGRLKDKHGLNLISTKDQP